MDHDLSGKFNRFIQIRHNGLVDITADLVLFVCKYVNEMPTHFYRNDNLRADIMMRVFWQKQQKSILFSLQVTNTRPNVHQIDQWQSKRNTNVIAPD